MKHYYFKTDVHLTAAKACLFKITKPSFTALQNKLRRVWQSNSSWPLWLSEPKALVMALGLLPTAGEGEVGGAQGDILMLFESLATFAQKQFLCCH